MGHIQEGEVIRLCVYVCVCVGGGGADSYMQHISLTQGTVLQIWDLSMPSERTPSKLSENSNRADS